jgi:NAD(P)-dependent dehydrogenase (short-subunit alcohol dehydrogenase family)
MGRLAGEVALVTGSTAGIGAAIARRFALEGASVVVHGRDEARGAAVVTSIGRAARFVAADLADPSAADALVAATVEHFGGLSVLVNNAAQAEPDGPARELDDERWQAIINVDLLAPARLCRAAIPHMMAAGHGAIVNISSRAAQRPNRGYAGYASAKGALEALTRSVAVDEAAHGIRCNAISPGYVLNSRRDADLSDEERLRRAAMHPLGLGTADDVAWAAVYLASPESRWLTGMTMPLDGGSSVPRAATFG